ncbi:MAG: hypothetical protein AAGE52_28320 [Myxococcota bacterium]
MSTLRATFLAFAGFLALGCGDDGGRGGGGRDGGGGGMCTPSCTAGSVCCSGRCSQLMTDPGNCGRCGNACLPGQSCTSGLCTGTPIDAGGGTDSGGGGMCSPACPSSQRCCGSSCVNRESAPGVLDARTDPSFGNCNGCGLACDMNRASRCGTQTGGAGGPPQCLCGNNLQCPIGQACVTNDAGTFLCANLQFDPMNCGMVGNRCAEGETCSSGVCGCGGGAACGAGEACCGGGCIDTSSDPMNCGMCGMECGANAPDCNGGTCGCGGGMACAEPVAGLLGMGGSPGESCCAGSCVPNTDTSCGCEACTGEDTCQVGGGGIIPGMGGETMVCCGDESVAILGCGGGLPFP